MKKSSRILYWSLGAAACAGAGFLYLIAPGRSRPEQRSPFEKKNFAHRGLYDPAAGIPENSMAAFRAAAEWGYGVELDVRVTRDGVAVISHDGNLRRMTGADLVVEECDWADIAPLRLQGTDEAIPRFDQVMDLLCRANVPVIVEVKQPPKGRGEALCRAVLAVLDEHDGAFCVESFNPHIVRWFRRHAPDLLRGQLTAQRRELDVGSVLAFMASRVMFNFLGRPHFIAHRVGKKALSVRIAEALGAMRVCWTAHDRREEAANDAVIFEHYHPPVRFL